MSGGVLDAVESLDADVLDQAEAGFRWLDLPDVAAVILDVRAQVESQVLDDDQAEALEIAADDKYNSLLPADSTLELAFRTRLGQIPDAFAAV
jgi:hypothetical protein